MPETSLQNQTNSRIGQRMIEATYGDIVPILKPLMDVLEGMADGAESLAGSRGRNGQFTSHG